MEDVQQLPVEWADTMVEALTTLWTKVGGFVPNFIGMIVILIVGYVIARLLRSIATSGLRKLGFDKASEKTGLSGSLQSAKIGLSASEIMGGLIFWIVILTFLIPAAETLGLENVSKTIDSLVSYLPNVVVAVLIVVVGLLLANFIKGLVATASESVGIDYAEPLSNVAFGAVIVLVTLLALEQLGINTDLINDVIQIALLAIGVAVSLSLGLGTRSIAGNIVAGVYLRDLYQTGARVTVGAVDGEIDSIRTITTAVKSADGDLIQIPNDQMIATAVRISGPGAS